jgi:hypothetical protein
LRGITVLKTLSPKCALSWSLTCCCKRDARVEHHAQQADDLQVLVQVGVHLLDRVDQVRQAFEREVLALHRHDHAVREHRPLSVSIDSGRAVDQDEVVLRVDGGQIAPASGAVAPLERHQFDLGAGEFAVGAEHVVAALRAARDARFGDGGDSSSTS